MKIQRAPVFPALDRAIDGFCTRALRVLSRDILYAFDSY